MSSLYSGHGPGLSPHHGSCGWLWCAACCCQILHGSLRSSCSVVGWTEWCPTTCSCLVVVLLRNIAPPHIDPAHKPDPACMRGGVCGRQCDAAPLTGCSRVCEGRWTACTHRRHPGLRSAPAAEGRLSQWGGCCPMGCPGQILSAPSGNWDTTMGNVGREQKKNICLPFNVSTVSS